MDQNQEKTPPEGEKDEYDNFWLKHPILITEEYGRKELEADFYFYELQFYSSLVLTYRDYEADCEYIVACGSRSCLEKAARQKGWTAAEYAVLEGVPGHWYEGSGIILVPEDEIPPQEPAGFDL